MNKSIEFIKKLIDNAISKGFFKNQEEIGECINHFKNLKNQVTRLEKLRSIMNDTKIETEPKCSFKCVLRDSSNPSSSSAANPAYSQSSSPSCCIKEPTSILSNNNGPKEFIVIR